jgi:hypothetical protein
MNSVTAKRRTATRLASIAVLAAGLVGCGDSGPPLIPVQGKVFINGKPASEGGVTFRSVDNQMVQLAGAIRPDGTYVMLHNRQEGAPQGQYIVTVLVTETAKTADGNYTGLPRTISNQKFSNPATTPLKVEVKEGNAAGSYDLQVTG